MITYFCMGWTGWLYVTWMPSLFSKNYGVDMKKSAMFISRRAGKTASAKSIVRASGTAARTVSMSERISSSERSRYFAERFVIALQNVHFM